jgi:hypothetical protein
MNTLDFNRQRSITSKMAMSTSGRSSNGETATDDDDDDAVVPTDSTTTTKGNSDNTMKPTKSVQSDVEHFRKTFSVWYFIDPTKPWVLVPGGSFGGHFDWIPVHLRVGPWSTVAVVYWTALWYGTVLTGCYYYWSSSSSREQWWTESTTATTTDGSTVATQQQQHGSYPDAYSIPWCYHVVGCVWMVYIMYSILYQSPLSYRAWSTYTVQSWTALCVRHGLCALTPWFPVSAVAAAEVLRFPCAVAHTVTFTVWNFVLVPYIVFHVFQKDPVKRKNFIAFCTTFRLTNLHVLNMPLCVLNVGTFGSPARKLEYTDLYIAVVSVMLYMTFYLGILDRLGVHLYPVFSPRAGTLVLFSWTGAILLYLATFYAWRYMLWPNVDNDKALA